MKRHDVRAARGILVATTNCLAVDWLEKIIFAGDRHHAVDAKVCAIAKR